MDGLRGCRVIIVDDKPSEAEPILRALGLKGIAAAYFKVSPEDDPPGEPCPPGVRLAILDLELGYSGLTGDNARVSPLLRVFKQIINPRNGPYVVLLWTNYPDDKEAFDKEIFREEDLPNPVVSLVLDKGKYGQDLDAIFGALEQELKGAIPFRLLQVWEEASYNAASGVTNLISDLVNTKPTDLDQWVEQWNRNVLQVIRAMATEEYGKGLDNPGAALVAFYSSVNPLHVDQMERTIMGLNTEGIEGADRILVADECDERKRAEINAMMHISLEQVKRPWIGKIYKYPEGDTWKDLFPNRIDVVEEFLIANKEKEKEKWERDKQIILEKAIPILIEINPVCDHAQGKVRQLRLIGGMLAKNEDKKLLKQPHEKRVGEFLWKLEQVYLSEKVQVATVYDLYLNARLCFSLKTEKERELEEIFQLRTQACANIQSWFSFHASRQGLFLLKKP